MSIATVSRVLRNNGYVAPATRKRVEEAIRATGFRVNAVAQGLRSQRTFTIGHLMQSIAPNPFFAQVALGVENEARRSGYSVLLFNVNGNPQFEAEGVNRLIERRVDADPLYHGRGRRQCRHSRSRRHSGRPSRALHACTDPHGARRQLLRLGSCYTPPDRARTHRYRLYRRRSDQRDLRLPATQATVR